MQNKLQLLPDFTDFPDFRTKKTFPCNICYPTTVKTGKIMEPLITLKDIGRKYVIGSEIIHALKSVTLTINKGEFVALMGPSGSGKSTLMNILGCLDTPTKGDYILNGINVSQMSDNQLAEVRN